MNRLLASALFLGLAILAIFIYRGRASKDSDILSGSIQSTQNLFTPDTDDESVATSADLPTVTPRGKSRVTTKQKSTQTFIRPKDVTKTYGDEIVETETEAVKRRLQESEGTKAIRRSWKAGSVAAATRPKSNTAGGFFLDDTEEELPDAIKDWEADVKKNRGKPKPKLEFVGRRPNVSEKSVPPAKTGNAQLKFLGRSEN